MPAVVAIIREENIHAPHVEIIIRYFRTFDNLTKVRSIRSIPLWCKAVFHHGFQGVYVPYYVCLRRTEYIVSDLSRQLNQEPKMFGGPRGSGPIMVLSQNTKRDQGKKIQQENIAAAKAIGDVVRTCLGPKAMLKMLMDPMGGIVMTNDGNAILREITVQHPAAKTLIEIARTQDEEVGDGTTSVIVLAAEMLGVSRQVRVTTMHLNLTI